MAIIRGDNHTNYKEALEYFDIKTLKIRRVNLCLKFAQKAYKHPKFSTWFSQNQGVVTRSGESNMVLKNVITRKKKFKKSPLPYLTLLLNEQISHQVNISENNIIMRLGSGTL